MARCDDIKLLLGPFEDGELEPHEMQEVARHVVRCGDCEDELEGYRSLAVALRGAAEMPDLTGFASAVRARIDQLPIPLQVRIRRYLTSFSGVGATLATGLGAAAVAVATAMIVTPYLKQAPFLARSRTPAEIARSSTRAPVALSAAQNVASADRESTLPAAIAKQVASGGGSDIAPAIGSSPQSPGAIISRLEADSPSVAVWSEPQTDTTVIWVPDQPQ